MRNKWTSRKFWISVAAFLGSIAASIAGIVTNEKWITITGIVCGMLSAAIYAAVEAYTDGANSTHTVEVIEEDIDDGK
jgi:drug/metabolite transporter (DMT)-like permease